ncbi:hypothetical protein E2L06_00380 [Haloterrigena sp. H1]|uniref:hypothetical protein n=1 Tax=Haloterrigena sp. H1 TaxID=2552943 RepID=UPI00110DEC4C|nr:hypothetical protein [Haloterrigena sp. H1]TMT85141.1 hypothetical protein E2L06_00380 [Haloterrigena sp. H1]
MDEDAVDGTELPDDAVQWRRDASTSRTVRLLWTFGVGTFFAAITIVVSWRLYRMASGIGAGMVIIALLAALAATVLALAATDDTERYLERLPVDVPSGTRLDRAMDAAVGTVVMGAVMSSLLGVGRYVSQNELLAVGASPFTALVTLLLPLALVALVLASFLQSVGTFDRGAQTIYLYEPKQAIDLAVIEDVSVRPIGDTAVLSLSYAQPDGQYVQGPRRLVVPPAVARDIATIVNAER